MELELFTRDLLFAVIAWISFHFILTTIKRSKFNPRRLPPGPFPLPIVGNIFSLGTQPHKALVDLAKSYGPVMTIHLGWRTTVVVTSVSMAKEILLVNDVSFANRCPPDAFTALDHHKCSVAMLPANTKWKVYRKIFNSHVFSKSRLDNTEALRKKIVQDLLSHVQTSSKIGAVVDIGEAAFMIPLSFLSNICFSNDLGDPNSKIALEFKLLVRNLLEEASVPNSVDALQHIRSIRATFIALFGQDIAPIT